MGVDLVEVPFNSSGLANGVARMPDALRDAGLYDALPALDHVVRVDVGDLVAERGRSGFRAEDALVRSVTTAREAVRRSVLAGSVSLVVGGDCPVLLGPLAALADAGHRPGLVFVDGHEDAWPPSLSPTGEAADSELGVALGLVPGPGGLADVLPMVAAEDAVLLGPRDAPELAAAGCPSLAGRVAMVDGASLATPPDADVVATVRTAVADAVGGTGAWWLHVDLDVLSTEALPAVDYPQEGGLGWERLELVAGTALEAAGCAGASVTIYNPELDGGAAAPRIVRFVRFLADALVQGGDRPEISW